MVGKLAWRNLWRNKRRSLLTMAAIAFAVFMAVLTRGMQLGTYEVNIRHTLELFTGYLQITRPGYQQNPSLRKSFPLSSALKQVLAEQPEIRAWAPRLQADGLVSSGEKSFGVLLLGLDPGSEARTSRLFNRIIQGVPFAPQKREVMVGERLLKNLGLAIGDSLVILSQAFDGSLGNQRYRITGVIKTGSRPLDQLAVLLPLSQLQELLSMPGRVTQIVIALGSLKEIDPVIRQLEPRLQKMNLQILSWEQILPELKQSIELDNISGILILAILVIVVAFGILNTMLMAITERFREFGVLLALGMRNGRLVRVVMMEILWLTLLGLLGGNLLGYGVNFYIVQNPIELGGAVGALYQEYGFIPALYSTVEARIFLNISLTMVLVSFASSTIPLYRVSRLEPLKGIRYT